MQVIKHYLSKYLIIDSENSFHSRPFNSDTTIIIKDENKDSFNYILLPPSFLNPKETDNEIVQHLEETYFKNYKYIIQKELFHLIVKSEIGIIKFLIKHLMKENAKITSPDKHFQSFFKSQKVSIIENQDSRRRIGIIDNNYAFEFINTSFNNTPEYVGYISSGNDYINKVRNEMQN